MAKDWMPEGHEQPGKSTATFKVRNGTGELQILADFNALRSRLEMIQGSGIEREQGDEMMGCGRGTSQCATGWRHDPKP